MRENARKAAVTAAAATAAAATAAGATATATSASGANQSAASSGAAALRERTEKEKPVVRLSLVQRLLGGGHGQRVEPSTEVVFDESCIIRGKCNL